LCGGNPEDKSTCIWLLLRSCYAVARGGFESLLGIAMRLLGFFWVVVPKHYWNLKQCGKIKKHNLRQNIQSNLYLPGHRYVVPKEL